MPDILALLFILAVVGGALWLFVALDAQVIAKGLRYGGFTVLALAALFVAARGMALLDLPIGAIAVLLLRHGALRRFAGFDRVKEWLNGAAKPRASTVETTWLRMTLDPASGALAGEVRTGRFAGAPLAALDLDQLRQLLADCAADPPSQRLLETWLDRTHPAWHEAAAGAEEPRPGRGAAMSRAEAFEILGLTPSATPAEIQAAYRRLMTKLHPDKGGSTYLASQINAARDLLLGSG